jgi:predicted amidohydrolase
MRSFLAVILVSTFAMLGCRDRAPATSEVRDDEEGKVEPIKEKREPSKKFDSKKFAKVAVVQWAPSGSAPLDTTKAEVEAWKQSNREAIAQYVREAAQNGAEMVITSEFGVVGYPDLPDVPSSDDNFRNKEDLKHYVEKVPGPTTEYFSKLAKELKVYIQVGFAEVDSKSKYYNTATLIDDKGKVIASHRKISLFKVEGDFLDAGSKPTIVDTKFGKIGLAICADIYSGNPMNEYAAKKVNIVNLSTSWAQYNTGMDHFVTAASRGGFYVLAANQPWFPDSGVVEPSGATQSHIRQSDGIAYGYVPRVSK